MTKEWCPLEIVDTHAHLNDERFNESRQEIIDALSGDGLAAVICVGFDRASSELGLELADKNRAVYSAPGVHPHSAKDFCDADYECFKSIAQHPKVVAIGETGLDYYYDFSPRDVQKRAFTAQLELAGAVDLPVIIHMRDATEDTLDILKANRSKLGAGGVVHCYSGSLETAKQMLDLGLLISFTGVITYKNAARITDVLAGIPLEYLMVETDCPYLTPEPYRGKLNEPKYVRLVAAHIARAKGISFDEVAEVTTANARRLFSKMTDDKSCR
ncbi:MAG: TatD family hydrolase [Firmicutes bacterium]|nr:TatD family hydrolase [Bacillota bacterium]